MDTLYNFITSLCKERDMKIEELQKKLGYSRSTLYRYMKGINQITPEEEKRFCTVLNMNTAESLEFAKFVRLSAFEQSLVESRYVIDEFLFAGKLKEKEIVEVDMVFYNNDKYLRTLREILTYILSWGDKEDLTGNIKIVSCINDNIFSQITEFLHTIFSNKWEIETEHFVSLSEKDYLQNTYSFVHVFPLIKYEKYKLYYKENSTEEVLLNDSMLISLEYKENGKKDCQYFAISFFESGMPECIAFNDPYMYSFQAKVYSNLKHSFNSVMQKYNYIDFNDDVLMEYAKQDYCYIIKPNPCYDKIPYEAFESLKERMSNEEIAKFLSALYGQEVSPEAVPQVLDKAMQYIKKRLEVTYSNGQIDIYSVAGLRELAATGMVTDQLEHLPPFNHEEVKMTLKYLVKRNSDPKDNYAFYITEKDMPHRDLIITAVKDYGIQIDYVYPEDVTGLWKLLAIRSKRLATVFCDYIENHIPVNQAMRQDEADRFMKELIESL